MKYKKIVIDNFVHVKLLEVVYTIIIEDAYVNTLCLHLRNQVRKCDIRISPFPISKFGFTKDYNSSRK